MIIFGLILALLLFSALCYAAWRVAHLTSVDERVLTALVIALVIVAFFAGSLAERVIP